MSKLTRTRRAPGPTLRSLSMREMLCFLTAWEPRQGERWRSWPEYLDAYEAVRDEFLVRHPRKRDGRLPFAERVRLLAKEHGREALQGATYEQLSGDDEGEGGSVRRAAGSE